MTRIACVLPFALLAVAVVAFHAACGGKGGGY